MTTDERLDRLTERHEALTQTAELMIHEQREMRQHEREWQQKNEEWWEKNQVLMTHMLESINTLARIAQVHERRISDLEGGRP
jgi:uncharacterized protein HemX